MRKVQVDMQYCISMYQCSRDLEKGRCGIHPTYGDSMAQCLQA